MRRSVVLRQQLRDSIRNDVARRTRAHQAKIAKLKAAKPRAAIAGAPASPTPLVMLAHGDSWFDYPLSGNDISLGPTDVIAQLQGMGNLNPIILNISHHGDATSDELSWPKQQRMIDALADPNNWMDEAKPDAILFSGGGNDIAGDQFCIVLNYEAPAIAGLNLQRYQGALGKVGASYCDLLAFRDRYASNVPVFAHCYDFAIPNGVHPDCAGPWLKPSLDYSGWTNLADATAIVHQALVGFSDLLIALSHERNSNFFVIQTQGTLGAGDWANELHPLPEGFVKIASKFVDALRSRFPGRI